MKKVVLRVEMLNERIKQKAMKAVSGLEGLVSIEINKEDNKLIVTGNLDPVTVVSKLRKVCHTQIVTVGPAEEEEKEKEIKPEEKPPEPAYPLYHCQPAPMNTLYYRPVVEECANGCVIC